MDYLNFYSHEQVSDSLFLFTEGYSMVHRFSIGVIVGADRVMVVDAGLGMTGDFRQQIEKVVGTDKPIFCCCTHGHIDHFGSAIQFDEAYVGEPDSHDLGTGVNFDRRMSDLAAFSLNNREVVEYGRLHALHNEELKLNPLYDGQVFDLGGGVVIELIAVPGHSAGSMCFFNRREKYVLVGDAINADSHLKHFDREGFARFVPILQHFIDTVGEDVTFYSGHLPVPQKIGVVKDLLKGAEALSRGDFTGDVPVAGIFGSQTTPRKPQGRYKISGNTLIFYNTSLMDPDGSDYDPSTVCVYGHEQVSEHVYVVTENTSVVHRLTIGVIEGEKEILVIDSGMGMNGALRHYIESFTAPGKPMICALTHGAVDHLGGASLFDRVYLSPADRKILPPDNDVDHRLMMLYSYANHLPAFVDLFRDSWLPIADISYTDVQDGDVFDLGGIQVEALALPGHTEGSMAYLLRKEHVVFVGDAVNADTFLLEMDEEELLRYSDTLDRFAERIGDSSVTLYSGHLNRGQTFATIANLAAACREVAAGNTLGDPPGQSVYVFEREKPSRRLHYHGNTCVVYDRSNFRR